MSDEEQKNFMKKKWKTNKLKNSNGPREEKEFRHSSVARKKVFLDDNMMIDYTHSKQIQL